MQKDTAPGASDEAAFAVWYTDHFARLRGLCARLLGDNAQAEDIAQEALLRAWLGRTTLREEDLGAWLTVVARNLCVSYMRKRWRAVPHDVLPEVADHSADPLVALEASETRRSVRRALAQVGHRHRRLLLMREVGGAPISELGEEFGLTEGGTRAVLFRARQSLRDRLTDIGEGLGAWLLGVKVRVGTATRRIHVGIGSLDGAAASAVLQIGLNAALVAGFAVSGVSDPAAASPRRASGIERAAFGVDIREAQSSRSGVAVAPDRPARSSRSDDSSTVGPRWQPGSKLGEGSASGGVNGPLGLSRHINLNIRWTDDPSYDSKTFAIRDRASEVVCPAPALCTGDPSNAVPESP